MLCNDIEELERLREMCIHFPRSVRNILLNLKDSYKTACIVLFHLFKIIIYLDITRKEPEMIYTKLLTGVSLEDKIMYLHLCHLNVTSFYSASIQKEVFKNIH